MPKVMLPLAAQPLWMPTDVLAAGPWEPVCAPVRLAAAASSVSFASIPAAYVMFRLRCQIVNDANAKNVQARLNNDSAGNYSYQSFYCASTTPGSARSTSQTYIMVAGEAASLAASQNATLDITIAKPIAGAAALLFSSGGYTSSTVPVLEDHAGIWSNTAALIDRIDILASSNNFAANSIFILEGSRF